VSGWLLRASAHPAVVPDELSETAWLTDRAIEFMQRSGDERWCAHVSYIKPHWPYVVSDPFHRLVSPDDVAPAVATTAELETDHPVLRAFRHSRIGRTFGRDDVRRTVIPAYLGLVAQIDHHLGRLFDAMERLGRLDDTMIVFCSDHGDYLGDHHQGDKDWLHDTIVRTPMIVVDPREAADPTRGTVCDDLVESIDLVPTLVDALGGDVDGARPWLEGTSLLPALHGAAPVEREAAFCETDFAFLEMSNDLPPTDRVRDRRATMVRTRSHKYILSDVGPNLLFDLEDDPDELHDRSGDPGLASVERELHERLFQWFRHRVHDVTWNDGREVPDARPGQSARDGIVIGYWDEAELESATADTSS